jgi:hypothetical protein
MSVQIDSQTTLLEIPRKEDGTEVLRLQFARGAAPGGRAVSWFSLRVFWKDEAGEWKPGKQGISLRAKELAPIVAELQKVIEQQSPTAPQERPDSRAPQSPRYQQGAPPHQQRSQPNSGGYRR